MKLAVMQPYLFPYIGYWQLIHAADVFVIFDDVNYINRGYINRNSILVNGKEQRFTLELKGASQNKWINQIDVGNNKSKLLRAVELAYKKSPNFKAVYPLIEKVLVNEEENLAYFVGDSIKTVSDYLGVNTTFIYSSDLNKYNNLKGQEKIIDIAVRLSADHYINAIGGQGLYDETQFNQEGIMLSFLKTQINEYKQFGNEFISYLSIIDILMFNDLTDVHEMLNAYDFI